MGLCAKVQSRSIFLESLMLAPRPTGRSWKLIQQLPDLPLGDRMAAHGDRVAMFLHQLDIALLGLRGKRRQNQLSITRNLDLESVPWLGALESDPLFCVGYYGHGRTFSLFRPFFKLYPDWSVISAAFASLSTARANERARRKPWPLLHRPTSPPGALRPASGPPPLWLRRCSPREWPCRSLWPRVRQ
jgi:hypothetical protein